MKIETLEIAGFVSALNALRLSYGKEPRSRIGASVGLSVEGDWCGEWYAGVDERDLELLRKLVKAGDEHAKVLRGVVVWCRVTAPRYWWQEAVTYDKIGAQCLMSESSMHIQGKGLSTEELVKMKEELKEGTEQTRVYYFSYQTLRRIWRQRKDHRLPVWHSFCDWIESLPLAEELILV